MALLLRFLPYIVGGLALASVYFWVDGRGFDRGFAERDAEARKVIDQMEQRMVERAKKNEGLTPDEVDCALRRLRNPKAECGK